VDIITLIAQTGGTLGLAIFAIWMLNRVWELRLEESKRASQLRIEEKERYAQDLREMNCEMKDVIERNTEAWMRMMERVNG
jgi:hypothetical protein